MQFSERKMFVLSILHDNGGSMRISDLARTANQSRNTMMNTLRGYEKQGLVQRDLTTDSVSITEKGIKRLEYLHTQKEEWSDEDIAAIWKCYTETEGNFY